MFGIYTRLRKYSINLAETCASQFYKSKRGDETFTYNKQKYNYFIHKYNYTWRNERCIEIPIIKKIIEKNSAKKILELGNVLSHYMQVNHDVLDKYEKGEGVINKDVVNFKSDKKYDLIIAISTLEHVGWDEKNQDYKKVIKAVGNLKALLKRNGKIIITHPLGYNFYMDEFIKTGQLKINQIDLMQRISKDNKWKQLPWKKQIIRYHYPFPYANGVIIGTIKK